MHRDSTEGRLCALESQIKDLKVPLDLKHKYTDENEVKLNELLKVKRQKEVSKWLLSIGVILTVLVALAWGGQEGCNACEESNRRTLQQETGQCSRNCTRLGAEFGTYSEHPTDRWMICSCIKDGVPVNFRGTTFLPEREND